MKYVSDKIFRETRNTHFSTSNNFFFRKSCWLWENVEKCCRAGQATDDNMVHAHCMLDTSGYRHTLTVCNTYCFSTATMAARSLQNVTLYVHCLPCWSMQIHKYMN